MLRFSLDGFHNRTVRSWSSASNKLDCRYGWHVAAKRHAKEHGAAGAWRADDSFILFYRDHDGRVRQKSWRHACPVEV